MVGDRVCVAQIGAPHGVRGEVRLWVFTEDPMAIADYGALETEDGTNKHGQYGAAEAVIPGQA